LKTSKSLFLLLAVVVIIILVPDIREFFKNQLTMKPALEALESEIFLKDEDYNIELKGVNTYDINLSELKGGNIFLNFWGTWCQPCIEEWPTIQDLYDDKKDNMNFVLVAMQDKYDSITEFLKQNNYSVPVYIATSPLPEKFLVRIFPTTFIIDKNGQILKREDGSEDWNSDKNREYIDFVTK